jgi:ATP-dependent DNA ligase
MALPCVVRVICERDMEGVVAKQASAGYTPDATTWVKIKNREYSQAVGREDFFNGRGPASASAPGRR